MKNALALTVCLCCLSPLFAATYTLDAINGSDTTGDGSASYPWASMAKVFTIVQGGDTVLLRPGNYGDVEFDENAGLGSAVGGHVTYMADPAYTTARPDTWYEQSLSRPDPANPGGKVIFTQIRFDVYSFDASTVTKTGTPAGHYVTLDGLNVVGGNVNIVSYVSHVIIRNCNVFGDWADYSTQITPTAFNLYRSYSWGSNYRNILIEDCYATHTRAGMILLGNFYDITIRGCHFHHQAGGMISLQGDMDQILVEDNHVHHQVPVTDTLKHEWVVATPDATEPDRIFTVSGDVYYYDSVIVTDADTQTKEIRVGVSFDHTTYEVVLDTPLSFDVEAGDEVEFWDDTHGSGIAVRNGNFTLRGNRIHDCGASRGIYFYTPGDDGYSDIIMENNLVYSTINQYAVDFHSGIGDNCVIRNNTFVGRRHSNYYTDNDADMYYGFGVLGGEAATNADASTITFANNIIVGQGSAPSGAIVKNNIVYAGTGFEEDSVGDNADNIVYYDGETVGNEPHPFDGSGNFFVGGGNFDTLAFVTQCSDNFNAAFDLVATADAVGYANVSLAPTTDIAGVTRDSTPDVGCYEGPAEGYPVLTVTETANDYYTVTAHDSADSGIGYWEILVDIQSGCIFSFRDLTDDGDGSGGHNSYLDTNAYNRQCSLIYFDGRGGNVFTRRAALTDLDDRLSFDTAADGSSFTITYTEDEYATAFFHHSYADGVKTLYAGDLLTTITLEITPPDEDGTAWDWTISQENVSDHDLSGKIWAQEFIYTYLDTDITNTADSEDSVTDGVWDELDPESYMRWTIGTNTLLGLTTGREIIIDRQGGLDDLAYGGTITSGIWAGFDYMRYMSTYESQSPLYMSSTREQDGQVLIDIAQD